MFDDKESKKTDMNESQLADNKKALPIFTAGPTKT